MQHVSTLPMTFWLTFGKNCDEMAERKAARTKITNNDVLTGTNKVDVNAVLSSITQSTIQCEPGSELAKAVKAIYTLLLRNTEVSRTDKAVIELQLISGCRIGSVLQITPKDVSEFGQVRIPPEKGGQSVIVTPQLYRDVWLGIRKQGLILSQFRDRFYFYRLYKKYGIYATIEGNTNSSVTHVMRHAAISGTESFDINERERANYAGQKSTKSQESYLPGKRKGSKNVKRD